MEKPNIIYILSDQHNASVMGCAGDPYVKTPNLDALAQQGTMLTNSYCNSPLCCPSRASMLSGLLPSENGVYNNMQALRSDQATFVHSLSVAGYETVLSGRMHFNGPDQRHGYEKRFVGDITNSHPGTGSGVYGSGVFRATPGQNRYAIEFSGAGNSAVLCFDHDVTDAACDYLEQRDDTRPLFMTVGLYGPHCPYICPEDLFNYYYGLLPEPEEITEEYRNSIHPAIQDWYKNRGVTDISVEDVKRVRAAYYGMVTHIDNLVGKIMNKIKDTLGLDNTIIVYGSDHGDNIGEHGLFWKTNFYEGSSRIPLIFSWKDVFAKNTKINGLTSLLDLAPTFIDIANGSSLPHMNGESLLENLKTGKEVAEDRVVISQLADIKGDTPSAMIRKNEYKFVLHYGHETPQLFDLNNDPNEYHDLAENPEYLEVRNELKEELLKYWDPEKVSEDVELAKAHLKILEKWGSVTNVEPVDAWSSDPKENYIIGLDMSDISGFLAKIKARSGSN